MADSQIPTEKDKQDKVCPVRVGDMFRVVGVDAGAGPVLIFVGTAFPEPHVVWYKRLWRGLRGKR